MIFQVFNDFESLWEACNGHYHVAVDHHCHIIVWALEKDHLKLDTENQIRTLGYQYIYILYKSALSKSFHVFQMRSNCKI